MLVSDGVEYKVNRGLDFILSGTNNFRYYSQIINKWGCIVPVLTSCRMLLTEDGYAERAAANSSSRQQAGRQHHERSNASPLTLPTLLSRCLPSQGHGRLRSHMDNAAARHAGAPSRLSTTAAVAAEKKSCSLLQKENATADHAKGIYMPAATHSQLQRSAPDRRCHKHASPLLSALSLCPAGACSVELTFFWNALEQHTSQVRSCRSG